MKQYAINVVIAAAATLVWYLVAPELTSQATFWSALAGACLPDYWNKRV